EHVVGAILAPRFPVIVGRVVLHPGVSLIGRVPVVVGVEHQILVHPLHHERRRPGVIWSGSGTAMTRKEVLGSRYVAGGQRPPPPDRRWPLLRGVYPVYAARIVA